MERAQEIWEQICLAVKRRELNSAKLSALLREYVKALPDEWKQRSFAIISSHPSVPQAVIPLEKLPEVIERDAGVRQLFIEMIHTYLKVRERSEG